MDGIRKIFELLSAFNWSSPSWDAFIMLAWVVVSVIYTFAAGRGRVINILLSIYISKLLVLEAPFITVALGRGLPPVWASLQQLAAFLAVFLIMFVLLGRYAFRTAADTKHVSGVLVSVIFSFLQIGLLINIILNWLPANSQNSFSDLIKILFINHTAEFIWLILPLIFLVAFGKFIGDSADY